MKSLKILIVDDHKVVRDGLRSMLNLFNDNVKLVMDEAETGEIAVIKARKSAYNLVIMDYRLPGMNGAETIKSLLKYQKEINILAFSYSIEFSVINEMIDAGAKGFISKNTGPDELFKAIETIFKGIRYFSNDAALKLIYANKEAGAKLKFPLPLSKRENEILTLISKELTNPEIASKLVISKRTVEKHRTNLIKKLKVKNTVGLIHRFNEMKVMG